MRNSEVNTLSQAEITDKLAEIRKSYTDMKMAHAVTPLDNPIQLRNMRRDIARLETALRNKQQ